MLEDNQNNAKNQPQPKAAILDQLRHLAEKSKRETQKPRVAEPEDPNVCETFIIEQPTSLVQEARRNALQEGLVPQDPDTVGTFIIEQPSKLTPPPQSNTSQKAANPHELDAIETFIIEQPMRLVEEARKTEDAREAENAKKLEDTKKLAQQQSYQRQNLNEAETVRIDRPLHLNQQPKHGDRHPDRPLAVKPTAEPDRHRSVSPKHVPLPASAPSPHYSIPKARRATVQDEPATQIFAVSPSNSTKTRHSSRRGLLQGLTALVSRFVKSLLRLLLGRSAR